MSPFGGRRQATGRGGGSVKARLAIALVRILVFGGGIHDGSRPEAGNGQSENQPQPRVWQDGENPERESREAGSFSGGGG